MICIMREVRVSIVSRGPKATLGKRENQAILAAVKGLIEKVSRDKPDIILLPEIFANHPEDMAGEVSSTAASAAKAAQTVAGPLSEELSGLARKYRTYIGFGLLRRSGRRLFNSLVLLDRSGKHVWTYDKTTPMPTEMSGWGETPGSRPRAFDCDFGRVAGAICFDINFLELAEIYLRQDAELILFSSAFPAGRLLDVWAIRYGFNVAGSTWYDYNRVIDCTGATVGQTSDILPCTTTVLNLNRRLVHMDFNLEKIERLLKKYAGDVVVQDLRPEATCVITSLKKGLEVTDLIREFRIERLPAYFDRSRRVRQEHGGLKVIKWGT